ncbi:MAG TPA: hypothetical protein VJ864_16590, partial [Candidatus Binatia bacterium]|nr:hypothetical protein [Candidatus Binatia bacterium]
MNSMMPVKIIRSLLVAGSLSLTVSACSSGTENRQQGDTSQGQSIPASSPKTAFERDLQFIRNGQFTYVWVFSRL